MKVVIYKILMGVNYSLPNIKSRPQNLFHSAEPSLLNPPQKKINKT